MGVSSNKNIYAKNVILWIYFISRRQKKPGSSVPTSPKTPSVFSSQSLERHTVTSSVAADGYLEFDAIGENDDQSKWVTKWKCFILSLASAGTSYWIWVVHLREYLCSLQSEKNYEKFSIDKFYFYFSNHPDPIITANNRM